MLNTSDINEIFNNLSTNAENCVFNELLQSKKTLFDKMSIDKIYEEHYYIPNVLSNGLCDVIVNESEKYARTNGWTKTRHNRYPTTDLPINFLLNIRTLVYNLVKYDIIELISEKFHVNKYLLDLADLFVVKYDSNEQCELEYHKDGSFFSFNVLLNDNSEFEGGGTNIRKSTCDTLVKNTKGGVLLHSGQIFHSGNKITKGKRYILVGFVNYLKDYTNEIPFNNDMNDINNFRIESDIMSSINNITKSSSDTSYMLDTSKEIFNDLEKFVYDVTLFHLNRIGKNINGDKQYYAEFWWRKSCIDNVLFVEKNFHYDKDEQHFRENKENIHPLLATVTYFDDVNLPTLILKENKTITLSFPSINKHLCFNGTYFHGVVKVLDDINNNRYRKSLMINIWENHKPSGVEDYKPNNCEESIILKNEKPKINLIENKHKNIIKLSNKDIDMLIKNINKGNDFVNFHMFKNILNRNLEQSVENDLDIVEISN